MSAKVFYSLQCSTDHPRLVVGWRMWIALKSFKFTARDESIRFSFSFSLTRADKRSTFQCALISVCNLRSRRPSRRLALLAMIALQFRLGLAIDKERVTVVCTRYERLVNVDAWTWRSLRSRYSAIRYTHIMNMNFIISKYAANWLKSLIWTLTLSERWLSVHVKRENGL